MTDFWHFAKQMLRYRGRHPAAVVMAVVSAAGLGIGMASMVPIMRLLMDNQASLPELARDFNQSGPIVTIPQWFIGVLPTDPLQGVIFIITILWVMAVFGATASFLHQYLSVTIAARTVVDIRQRLFRHVIYLPLATVVERGPSEYVARVVRDAAELQRGFLALTSKSVAQATRGLACFAAALIVSWQVALVAPVCAVVFAVILRKFGKRIRRGTRGSLRAQEQLLRMATESVQGLRAVKASTAEHHASWRFHGQNKKAFREELRARLARAFSGPLVELLATFMVGGLAIMFAMQILRGQLAPEQMFVTLAALAAAGASFKPLTGIIQEVQASSAPASRLLEVLDEEREARVTRRRPPRHAESVALESVTFRYPGSDRVALDDVSLRVEYGQKVAIVGPNGSGKTTLVSLLPRLLRPSGGRVLIDGVDIESISLRGLRSQIGVVTQETVLFRGSVAENIALGGMGIDRAEIVAAAKRAHAHEFIEQLSGGYDADIAEQGASLSGGQRQRIAIARAILVLDEATSQIDAESEAGIAEALREFCTNRTSIVIAHRLMTVMDADLIVVMDDGRVVDQGRHDELMERCDVYQRLVKTQLGAPA